MDIKDPEPLIVEVETADGTMRNVLLTQGIDIKHFFEVNDHISYFFDRDATVRIQPFTNEIYILIFCSTR